MTKGPCLFCVGCLLIVPCSAASAGVVSEVDARVAILAPQSGSGPIDQKISALQTRIKGAREPQSFLVQLGWAFVAKARISSDPGFYTMADLCAQEAGQQVADDADALLLRGHVAHAMHRFAEVESVARKLTAQTEPRWESFALLGDGLMEQGKLAEAIDAYQRMIDIRPCLQTYARVAHVRWLKGDLKGAEELMMKAVAAGSARDPEPAAWALTRLANYQLQSANLDRARRSAKRAIELVPNYPPALLVQAKLLSNKGKHSEALPLLQRAVMQSPLPEFQWALADVAHAAGDDDLAITTEKALRAHGKTEDARSLALFLATRRETPALAFELAKTELNYRRDVFTYDAVAWVALAAGNAAEAQANIERALAEGTSDARLFYHAGKIALANGNEKSAAQWFERTKLIQQTLLPSERVDFRQEQARLAESTGRQSIFSANKQTARVGHNLEITHDSSTIR
jgi:tetratricopeptide (TPR) repeat protein